MLHPSFVPPHDIRRLRDYTRLRADLVHDRARHWARLEKLLERALIKAADPGTARLGTRPAPVLYGVPARRCGGGLDKRRSGVTHSVNAGCDPLNCGGAVLRIGSR
jgi:hypothetical protein